jgi:D-serine deaminase-like pyridoxal phosphate-dependent protein
MERNIARMAEFFAGGPCRLRPHFKAHKTPEIARRQLAAGSCVGLTCQTVGEAEVIAAERITDDILISNEVLGPGKEARVAALAARAKVKVAVDSMEGLVRLATAARHAGVEIGVLVDVNVGLPRCGVAPREPAVELARAVHEMEGLRLEGLMGYEGHAVGIEDREEREGRTRKAMSRLLDTVAMVRDASLPCEIVSAGGTGTFDITGRIDGVTEIQAGSYVLMDGAYNKLGLPFERAMVLAGTVLSRPRPELCAIDGGLKACAVDHGNPTVKNIEGAEVLFLSDEHTSISLPPGSTVAPGDRIELWPAHIDPTINLHDVLYAVEGGEVVGIWPVAARGYREQRLAGEAAEAR